MQHIEDSKHLESISDNPDEDYEHGEEGLCQYSNPEEQEKDYWEGYKYEEEEEEIGEWYVKGAEEGESDDWSDDDEDDDFDEEEYEDEDSDYDSEEEQKKVDAILSGKIYK